MACRQAYYNNPYARVLKNNQEIISMAQKKKITYSGRQKKYKNNEVVCNKITANNVILAV